MEDKLSDKRQNLRWKTTFYMENNILETSQMKCKLLSGRQPIKWKIIYMREENSQMENNICDRRKPLKWKTTLQQEDNLSDERQPLR